MLADRNDGRAIPALKKLLEDKGYAVRHAAESALELLEREGVDLKVEMAQKMKEMEELWRKEKEQADQAFQQERKKYEDQIETLQKQVTEQTICENQTKPSCGR